MRRLARRLYRYRLTSPPPLQSTPTSQHTTVSAAPRATRRATCVTATTVVSSFFPPARDSRPRSCLLAHPALFRSEHRPRQLRLRVRQVRHVVVAVFLLAEKVETLTPFRSLAGGTRSRRSPFSTRTQGRADPPTACSPYTSAKSEPCTSRTSSSGRTPRSSSTLSFSRVRPSPLARARTPRLTN